MQQLCIRPRRRRSRRTGRGSGSARSASGALVWIYADINRYALYGFIALAVLLAGYITWRVLRRRRAPPAPKSPPGKGRSPAEGSQRPRAARSPRGDFADPEPPLGATGG